jgi:hypothetical protein
MKAIGKQVETVNVDPDLFIEWCRLSGKQPDGAARAEYASTLSKQSAALSEALKPPVQISWKQ